MVSTSRTVKVRLETTKTVRAFGKKLDKFSGFLGPYIASALEDVGHAMATVMKETRLSSPETGQPWLAVRSGALRRAVDNWKVTGNSLGQIVFTMIIDVPYAKVHEFGTIGAGGILPDIVPVRASWLTIPLEYAKTPTGIALGSAREVGAEYDDTFVDWENYTNPIMFGTRGEWVYPLFVFVKRVAIPPRLGFFDTWDKLEKFRDKKFKDAVSKAKAKAKLGDK